MHRQALLLLVSSVALIGAQNDGYSGSSNSNSAFFGGFGFGGSSGGGGYGEAIGSPVNAAIATKRTFEVRPVVLQSEPPVPSVVDVQPSEQPVQVIFRTQSSPVLVQQIHTPSAPVHTEKTNSEDEPHRVLHEVMRPVLQEVREIIQPFRRVTQEVRPVVEEVHTVVAKGEKRPYGHYQHHHLPLGYQEHHHTKHHHHGIIDELPYGLTLSSNELAAPSLAVAPPQFTAQNLQALAAAHNSELYLTDPRLGYRLAKLAKAKRPRVKPTRSA